MSTAESLRSVFTSKVTSRFKAVRKFRCREEKLQRHSEYTDRKQEYCSISTSSLELIITAVIVFYFQLSSIIHRQSKSFNGTNNIQQI